jgi:hypothetical protein
MKRLYPSSLLLLVVLMTTHFFAEPAFGKLDESDNLAGTVSGPTAACVGTTGSYTVSGSSATTGYTWDVPAGVTITSGAGTKTINVSFNSANMGTFIHVSGNGLDAGIVVAVYAKITGTGTLTGPATICPGQTGVVYSLSGYSNVVSYSWNVGAAVITSNNNSSITVSFPSSYTGGTIAVTAVAAACGPAPTVTKTISTGGTLPAAAGTISGASTVCAGQASVAYSVPVIANAVSYVWSVPSGASIASGSNTNSITINFSSSAASGSINVYATNCMGNGASSSLPVAIDFPVNAPGVISGATSVCEGTSAVYSVAPIAYARDYVWMPGGTVNTNTMTLSIPVNYSSSSMNLNLFAANSCGRGADGTPLTVAVYKMPGSASSILGPTGVCAGQNGVAYSVASITNASGYAWTLPSGASIVSGSNTPNITVNFSSSFTGGNLTVAGTNGPCSTGSLATFPIAKLSMPAAAGAITGASPVCLGQTSVTYSVPAISSATGYVWSLPSGASIVSGSNTNQIVVNFSGSAVSGNISVYGTNCLGNGTSSSKPLTVTLIPSAPTAIIGNKYVCASATNIVYSIDPVASATAYTWTVPLGATLVSGQNTTSITVNFSPGFFPGQSVAVRAQNCSGTSAVTSLALSTDNKVGGRGPAPSVDPVTGLMSASIPLFTCQDGDAAIPVNLNYTASGVRVTDTDGYVGHNWSLSVGSYLIAREVRGLPDDYTATSDARKGWLYGTKRNTVKNFTINTDNNPSTCCDEATNHTFLNSIGYNEDTEPDAFYVNGPGISFEFYFDENRVPRVMPYEDVVITAYTAAGVFSPTTTSGLVTSFTVVDSRGFKYTFADVETMTESLSESNNYYLSRYSKMHRVEMTYAMSWRLTSVVSPMYGTVNFTYKTVNTGDVVLTPVYLRGNPQYKYRFPNEFNDSDGLSGRGLTMYHAMQSTLKILQKISSPTMEAVFTSAPKNSGTTDERLTSIGLYEKRSGASTLIRSINFQYSTVNVINSDSYPVNYKARTYLTSIRQTAGCFEQDHTFEYYTNDLPSFSSSFKDDWGFYSYPSYLTGPIPYDESVIGGTLKRIVYPYKGYDIFFYEPHHYWNGTTTVQGGGIRLRKMISYDGVSTDNNIVKEYEYQKEDGTSSGKLQYKASHKFNVAVLHRYTWANQGGENEPFLDHARYLQLKEFSLNVDFIYRIGSDDQLDHNTMFHGSVVAYERVTVMEKDAGKTVYDFDLPASYGDLSANNGEWQASKVLIARPSATATCYQIDNVEQGANVYPFAPNPNYDFAKGLLKKETSYNEAGTKVKDIVYNYQRVYGNGTGIQKIVGLAIEELPTYYKNGSAYVDNTMYAFSKYEIYTGVKSELSSTVETVYNSADLLSKTVTSTNFFFDSPNHKELRRIVSANSDGSESATTFKYVKDYVITTPSGVPATALANLKTANRNMVVETMSSKISAGTENYTSSSLMTHQTLSGKVYPHMAYSFHSSAGTAFVPSSILNGSTFKFEDTKYVLNRTFQSFDSYGNPVQIVGKDRKVSSVIAGFTGTVPIITVDNAGTSEFKYSDFDATTSVDFYLWGAPTFSVGRNNTKALNLPVGSESQNVVLGNGIPYNKTQYFIFSCWIKAPAAGTFSVLTAGSVNATYSLSFAASSEWKYYTLKIPTAPIIGTGTSFNIKLWSNTAIQVDDLAFYPEQATFIAYNYDLPFGKKSETDSRGNCMFYEYDQWGRLRVVYDRDKNITNVYEFKAMQ